MKPSPCLDARAARFVPDDPWRRGDPSIRGYVVDADGNKLAAGTVSNDRLDELLFEAMGLRVIRVSRLGTYKLHVVVITPLNTTVMAAAIRQQQRE